MRLSLTDKNDGADAFAAKPLKVPSLAALAPQSRQLHIHFLAEHLSKELLAFPPCQLCVHTFGNNGLISRDGGLADQGMWIARLTELQSVKLIV